MEWLGLVKEEGGGERVVTRGERGGAGGQQCFSSSKAMEWLRLLKEEGGGMKLGGSRTVLAEVV